MQNIERITTYLKVQLDMSDSDAAVVRYALQVLQSTIVNLMAIVIVAWLLGVLKYALSAALAASLLRVITGGAHSAKLFNCSLMGAVISPGIGVFVKYGPVVPREIFLAVVVFSMAAAALTTWLYAPADTPSKPITKLKQKRNLRVMAALYIMAWITFSLLSFAHILSITPAVHLAMALGVIWQAASLTPAGYAMVRYIDQVLPK